MLQDVEAGRSLETEALIGSILEMAKLTNTAGARDRSRLRAGEASQQGHAAGRWRRESGKGEQGGLIKCHLEVAPLAGHQRLAKRLETARG